MQVTSDGHNAKHESSSGDSWYESQYRVHANTDKYPYKEGGQTRRVPDVGLLLFQIHGSGLSSLSDLSGLFSPAFPTFLQQKKDPIHLPNRQKQCPPNGIAIISFPINPIAGCMCTEALVQSRWQDRWGATLQHHGPGPVEPAARNRAPDAIPGQRPGARWIPSQPLTGRLLAFHLPR